MSVQNDAMEIENQNSQIQTKPPAMPLDSLPTTSRSKLPILVGTLALLLVSSLALNGYLLWINNEPTPASLAAVEEQQSPSIPVVPATPTSQPTMVPADQLDQWLPYQQPGIAIQFKYLDTFKVQNDTITDGYGIEKKIIAFQNTGKFEPEGFDVVIMPGTKLSSYLLDVPVADTVVGGQAAVYAELPDGYSDMGSTTRPMVIVETIYQGNNYTFRFVGLSDYKHEFVQQVIKTVMFK